MKLTTLSFGLLMLAVGWTGSAQAQKLPDRSLATEYTKIVRTAQEHFDVVVESLDGPTAHSHATALKANRPGNRLNAPSRAGQDVKMASLTEAEAKALTYNWTDANGGSHTSNAAQVAKDPYQMYELLKFVYTDKRFPGPYYSAYTNNDERERPVYYGAVDGGWDISGPALSTTPVSQVGAITIRGNNDYAMIYSITVTSGNTTLFSWNYATDGTGSSASTGSWPAGMHLSRWGEWTSGAIGFNTDGNYPITLDEWLFTGYSSVTVRINARSNSSSNSASIVVNDEERTFYSTTATNYTWTVNGTSYAHTEYDPNYYKPTKEGYTALIVAVKNHTTHPSSSSTYSGSFFTTKAEVINYLTSNIDSIQLLTDGLRIGDASDYSIGTVFNCEGTYNKFFFLGKGQAKQKPDIVINREITMQHALGELVPFKNMFEQFSPTQGGAGDQTTNFYSLMNEGNVYNVVHDCRSVLELGHQFSMSGNSGEKAYAMTGMNFFIPDYRLKYWEDQFNYRTYYVENGDTIWHDHGTFTVDGRITNPYQSVSANGSPVFNKSLRFKDAVDYSFWYAWYNQDYAPKVGLYKITLDAVATPVAYDPTEGNRNYAVTLTWVSSLDEMTGHDVEQVYTVYYWDPVTGEKKYVEAIGITDGQTGLTTVTYLVEQKAHSYKIEYIVEGHPTADTHSHMVAVSNIDDVVIPGWEDFVGLQLDHHESDFVVNDMANWYRNFLVVVNEDIANGLTVNQITGYNEEDPSSPNQPMNQFKLYRFEYDENGQPINEKPIATVTFSNPTAQEVTYTITYDDVNVQQQYRPEGAANKYDLDEDHLDVPLTGTIRLKGNGDIVIWPNGYHVNFKSIVIKDNGNVVASWDAETMNTLPAGWEMSSGSKWEEYTTTNTGDKVGYVEGGGYIYIPNMLNNSSYTNLTIEIVAYGDGAAVTRIAVNDKSKLISNTPGVTYTWGTTDAPLSPAAAPKRDNTNNNSNN
ncbi:MAG: hypothetical protein IJV11_04220 [Muribaculaceae bacterium]|nr:hypothetical protein [Muribaculaceae bacterium]